MIKIITAIGNPYINKKLSENKKIKILEKDIQYKDAIIEILEKNKSIDILILNSNLPGEIDREDLIKKVKKINHTIKIVYVDLENDYRYIEGNIKKKKAEYEKHYDEIVDIILKKLRVNKYNYIEETMIANVNINKKNKKESIKKIKNDIKIFLNFKVKNILKKSTKKYAKKSEKSRKNKIVIIAGNSGVGKTITLINLAYFLSYKRNKILICEDKKNNKDISTIMGVKLASKIPSVETQEVNINKRIVLKNDVNIKCDWTDYKDKEKFDFVIIEVSEKIDENIKREILQKCDKIILVVDPNLIGIKNSKKILDNYEKKLNIEKDKINILINKFNKYSINENLLKIIFSEYLILGKINYKNKYNYYINKKYKEIIFNKNIKKEYEKILEKMI